MYLYVTGVQAFDSLLYPILNAEIDKITPFPLKLLSVETGRLSIRSCVSFGASDVLSLVFMKMARLFYNTLISFWPVVNAAIRSSGGINPSL
jgi:hypothetical protein